MAKKYALLVDDDQQVTAVEVDGRRYKDPGQIPDLGDQLRIKKLLAAWPEQEGGILAKKGPDVSKVIPIVFGTIALISLIFSVLTAFSAWRRVSAERAVPGLVVDVVPRQDSEGDLIYFPVIQFSLPDGRPMRVEVAYGSSPASHQTGEAVTVLYDPAHAEQARIQSFASSLSLWLAPILTGIFGAVFIGAAVFAMWMMRET